MKVQADMRHDTRGTQIVAEKDTVGESSVEMPPMESLKQNKKHPEGSYCLTIDQRRKKTMEG
ncbi:uncharacterized protein PADG_07360 [Paracoccidioides brasiliensis Pb18]|uniref:Uncharacterized protein n=2 Tax=Paracoccidioides brasiliensis TaxID=121759 RepID=C1GJC4_PARBD|nr:uncharacterized protein PADG_07360 [Paracoccidioides brasiliensis Pb18]EEH42540.2 hypothetical protein PADG_07360 [Paracoccidioides brasiliensis Pb18]ODH26416.1 hypothetical protein ACO22_04634 [Paracoccidioides brasiliensis]ODH52006.1 hypothetical protein GX48_01794 [Paracoccidioides brasiliensis]